MTHLECNPQIWGNTSKQGGLRLHGWKVQMGLSQGDLLPLQKSFQAAESTNPRRVLSGLRLQPQIRYPAAQWSSTAKVQGRSAQRSSCELWHQGDLVFDGDLGSRGLPLFSAAQSASTVVGAVGDQALGAVSPSPKAAAYDQSRHHRPATEIEKAPTEKAALRAHQTRHVAQTPHPYQDRLLGCQKPRLYRNRSSLSLRQLSFGRISSVAQCHRYSLNLGGKPCGDGQRPDRGVLNAMQEIEQALPFKLLGIDSDNGSEFINYHLKTFCDKNKIQFTRGRPYKKDDNAHIEQKNYTHVRKIFGYVRYDSQAAQQAINELYQNELRILQNLFLPSMKLIEKTRQGSKLKRRYDKPKTPWERLLHCPQADSVKTQQLKRLRNKTDPFQLAKRLEQKLERIYQMANHRVSPQPLEPEVAPLTRSEKKTLNEISKIFASPR